MTQGDEPQGGNHEYRGHRQSDGYAAICHRKPPRHVILPAASTLALVRLAVLLLIACALVLAGCAAEATTTPTATVQPAPTALPALPAPTRTPSRD